MPLEHRSRKIKHDSWWCPILETPLSHIKGEVDVLFGQQAPGLVFEYISEKTIKTVSGIVRPQIPGMHAWLLGALVPRKCLF